MKAAQDCNYQKQKWRAGCADWLQVCISYRWIDVAGSCHLALPVTTQWTGAHDWSQFSYNSVDRDTRLVTVQLQLSGQGHTIGHSYNSVDRGTRLVTVTTQWTGAHELHQQNRNVNVDVLWNTKTAFWGQRWSQFNRMFQCLEEFVTVVPVSSILTEKAWVTNYTSF